MIHVVMGPDYYLANRRVREITQAADPEGLGTTRFDAGTAISEIEMAVATPGFFGSARVVVATNLLGKASGDKAEKTDPATLTRLAAAISPGNVLVLFEPIRDSLPKTFRTALGTDVEEYSGAAPRGQALRRWVEDRVAARGGTIGGREVEILLDRLFPGSWMAAPKNPLYDNPPDMQRLVTEIEKLVTFAGNEAISEGAISSLVNTGEDDQIFAVVSAIVRRESGAALKGITTQGADDDDAARLVAILAANAEMGQIVARSDFDRDLKQTAKDLGLSSSGRLYNLRKDLQGIPADKFAADMLESDRSLKTGVTRSPGAQLEQIILLRTQRSKRAATN